jgi:hypothetical protein
MKVLELAQVLILAAAVTAWIYGANSNNDLVENLYNGGEIKTNSVQDAMTTLSPWFA